MDIRSMLRKKLSKKLIFVAMVICIICVAEFQFGNVVVYDDILYQQEDVMSLLCNVHNYQIDGRTYEMTGEDPQLLFRSEISCIDTVRVKFAEPVKEDMIWTVYYDDGSGLSQSKAVIGQIKKGNENACLSIPRGKYQYLRLDIDGNFSLENIFFEGSEEIFNYVKCFFYIILCVVVNFVIWFFRREIFEKLYCLCKRWVIKSNRLNGLVYDFFAARHIRLETTFLMFAVILGFGYSFLIPPGEVPDELTHMLYIERAIGLNEETEKESREYLISTGFYDVYNNIYVEQDVNLLNETAKIRFSDTARQFTGHVKIRIIRHLPAALGFCIGVLLNLPIYFCLRLAETCAVLFYAIIGYFALKQMPVMRKAFGLAMLMPMTLQQCASINYDAVLLPLCFWLVSYILHCAYVKEKVAWRHLVIMLVVSAVCLLIKPPYVLLLLLFFVIPREKIVLRVSKVVNLYELFYKRWYVFCTIFLLVFGVGLYIFKENIYVRILHMWLTDFPKMIELYRNTVEQNTRFYLVSLVGNFGWLVFPMPMYYIWFTLILLFISSICGKSRKENRYSKYLWRERSICVIVTVFLVLMIIFTMISWSFFLIGADVGNTYQALREALYSINAIDGVQGRYFIPIVPVILLVFHGLIDVSDRKAIIYYILAFIVWEAVPVVALVDRFWI